MCLGMYMLHHKDLVPKPHLCEPVLRACRRVNDIALAIRFLEGIKIKCGSYESIAWPYIMQEVSSWYTLASALIVITFH